eukprot:366415-Chlamydomonas_euryale.AAC.7
MHTHRARAQLVPMRPGLTNVFDMLAACAPEAPVNVAIQRQHVVAEGLASRDEPEAPLWEVHPENAEGSHPLDAYTLKATSSLAPKWVASDCRAVILRAVRYSACAETAQPHIAVLVFARPAPCHVRVGPDITDVNTQDVHPDDLASLSLRLYVPDNPEPCCSAHRTIVNPNFIRLFFIHHASSLPATPKTLKKRGSISSAPDMKTTASTDCMLMVRGT